MQTQASRLAIRSHEKLRVSTVAGIKSLWRIISAKSTVLSRLEEHTVMTVDSPSPPPAASLSTNAEEKKEDGAAEKVESENEESKDNQLAEELKDVSH